MTCENLFSSTTWFTTDTRLLFVGDTRSLMWLQWSADRTLVTFLRDFQAVSVSRWLFYFGTWLKIVACGCRECVVRVKLNLLNVRFSFLHWKRQSPISKKKSLLHSKRRLLSSDQWNVSQLSYILQILFNRFKAITTKFKNTLHVKTKLFLETCLKIKSYHFLAYAFLNFLSILMCCLIFSSYVQLLSEFLC